MKNVKGRGKKTKSGERRIPRKKGEFRGKFRGSARLGS